MSKKSRSDRPASVSLGVPAGAGPDRSLVWLVLIIAFAAILRLYALGTVPHGFTNDEAQDGLSARQAIDTGMQVFYPENNGREGLYVNISSLLIRMLGNTIWAMRLPAAVFGILTVWIIYLLGAVLFSKSTGLWAALFTAASTWHLFNSRLTNRANLAPFFLSLALYLLFLAVRKVREGGTSLPWAISAGLIYGLGFHSYTSFRVTPALLLPLGVYSLLRAREEAWRRKLYVAASAFAAACLLAIAPLAHYFSTHPGAFSGRVSQVSVWSHPNPAGQVLTNIWAVAQMFFLSGDTDWKNNIAGRRELFFPVAICFAAGLYCALHAILKRREGQAHRRFGYALMLGWIVLGAFLPS